VDDAAKVAEQLQRLTVLVQDARSLYFGLSTALVQDGPAEVVYAAKAVHEMCAALAKVEWDVETLAAAHREGYRKRVMADLKKAWDAGFAEAMRRAHAEARSTPLRALRAVTGPRTGPRPARLTA